MAADTFLGSPQCGANPNTSASQPIWACLLRSYCKTTTRYLGLRHFNSAPKTHGLDSDCSFIPKRTEDILKDLPNFSLASMQIPTTRHGTVACSLHIPSDQNHTQLMAGAK